LAKVRHPHVVTIHDVIEAGELCAYAMEWIDGKSLADLLEELAGWPRRGPAPDVAFGGEHSACLPRDAVVWFCRLGIAIARALAEVHRHGLVHRDVKPSNILLRADGTPLLSDFGVVRDGRASLTRTGQIAGTPAFAPPEQLRIDLERIGPATDVFALGVTLHWAFAGRAPFAGRTAAALATSIEARARRPLTALGLPRDLETIVGKCVEPRIETATGLPMPWATTWRACSRCGRSRRGRSGSCRVCCACCAATSGWSLPQSPAACSCSPRARCLRSSSTSAGRCPIASPPRSGARSGRCSSRPTKSA